MLKRAVVSLAVLLLLCIAAVGTHFCAEYWWKRKIDSCFAGVGSGERIAMPLVVPDACKSSLLVINDSAVNFVFRPPPFMWMSYLFKTADYDTYVVEIRRSGADTRAHLHHGSD